jgi:uncharacterized iron-regulated membrane protein
MTDRLKTREGPVPFWQDWRWIAAIAIFIFALAITTLAVTTVQTNNTIDQNSPLFAELKTLTEQNHDALSQLQNNQAGINELVTFVHQVEAQQAQNGNGNSAAVNQLEQVLCATTDPARIAACQQLGIQPVSIPSPSGG